VALGLRLSAGTRAWAAQAALLGVGALAAWWLPAASWDWEPGQAFAEPWRWWTAAFVHWSPLHLGANLLALAVVAAFGVAGQVPRSAAWAWFVAWPLSHGALLVQPALVHYGGLSGVLHAGVAAATVSLLLAARGRRRRIAAAVLAGMTLKIVLEAPWGEPLRHSKDWDIAVAPLAHATGAVAGALLAALFGAIRVGMAHRQSPP
jgi:rhomboid family GlyGly-CTERM serine protease